MKKISLLFAVTILIAACSTKDKKSMLLGKWQAIHLDNPQLIEMMDEQNSFLDTFGKNNTDEQNMEIYGFTNIDSARDILKSEMTEYMAMQDHAIKNTNFEFRKDGWVIMDFSGQVDSTKWKINDEGKLTLNKPENSEGAEDINMEILELTDTMMKLQMSEQGMSSTVIFKPADK